MERLSRVCGEKTQNIHRCDQTEKVPKIKINRFVETKTQKSSNIEGL